MKNFGLTIYQISNFFYNLMVLNLLIILFSIVGVVIGGFFPSLASAFAITRNWIILKKEPPILKEFVKYYKIYFVRSNILGYVVTILIVFFYFDFYFFQTFDHSFLNLISYLYLPLLLLSILTSFYTFPIFVNYDVRMRAVIKNSFLVAIGNPFISILILISIVGIWIILYFVPLLFIFVGISLTIYIIMYFSHLLFKKIESNNRRATS